MYHFTPFLPIGGMEKKKNKEYYFHTPFIPTHCMSCVFFHDKYRVCSSRYSIFSILPFVGSFFLSSFRRRCSTSLLIIYRNNKCELTGLMYGNTRETHTTPPRVSYNIITNSHRDRYRTLHLSITPDGS